MNESSRRWSFTTWSPPVLRKMQLCSYLLYQSEYSPNSRLHYQGYVEFKNPYKQATVKSLFSQKGMHCEPSRESKSANIIYCTKLTGYAGTRYCYDETSDPQVRYENNPEMEELKLTLNDFDDIFYN